MNDTESFFTIEQLATLTRTVIILFIGFATARLVTAGLGRYLKRRTSAQHNMVIRRMVHYSILALTLASALTEIGLDLSVLLGAAGVLTVAVGFAAKTSASNLVSGIFLMGEQSFGVSDIIGVDGYQGEVVSVDLLSIKLRTFDNRFVRVPNEKVLSSSVVNLTRFPIRRADLFMRVDYHENLDEIRDVLTEIARRNPICLADPQPLFLVKGFGDMGVDLQFSVWTTQANYIPARNTIQAEITKAFAENDIPLPKLHRVIVSDQSSREA